MHIPGKPLLRPKQSRFHYTSARRLAYAARLRRSVINTEDEAARFTMNMLANRIEDGCFSASPRRVLNQRQIRKRRGQQFPHGFHPSFN